MKIKKNFVLYDFFFSIFHENSLKSIMMNIKLDSRFEVLPFHFQKSLVLAPKPKDLPDSCQDFSSHSHLNP